jgi:hypothetical protein
LLNPFLYDELKRLHPSVQVLCFTNLDDGLRDFAKVAGVKAKKLPTEKESRAIKDELAVLPPLEVPSIPSTSVVFAPTIAHAAGTSRVLGLSPNLIFACPNCNASNPVAWHSFQPPTETSLLIECQKCGWSGYQKASEGKPIK